MIHARALRVALLVAASLSLAGCATAEPAAPKVPQAELPDYTAIYQKCMEDRGWEYTEGRGEYDGAFSYPEEQGSAFLADDVICTEEMGLPAAVEPTADDYRRAWQAGTLIAECLAENGYDVPEYPSEQEYVDQELGISPYELVPWNEDEDAKLACPPV